MATIPALLGDAEGKYRIHLVGNCGVGKSTLGRELSKILSIPYFDLDEVYWKPGWKEPSPEEFEAKIQQIRDQHSEWVIDGNYSSQEFNLVCDTSTDVIWLDPPFVLYFYRMLARTLRRIAGVAPPCSSGCDDTLGMLFSKNSIVLWCIAHHHIMRERGEAHLRLMGIHVGGKMRRIGGWGSGLIEWLEAVRQLGSKEV
ncbi:hypothetical protein BDN72DRAFT_870114 [Pluteus cervinus]|uniref:Uncharacterized protein n=1 Tax=Pluteus cervinus TaxID=181527 RepID=A0ACD3AYI5_9AGAR|nr:hypothetical protein BDN72DRAFT_870114 [Pluteus cervinus]